MPNQPEYKVYRSRKSPFGFLKRDEPGGLSDLRRDRQAEPKRPRKPITVGRVVKWVALAVLAWILLSAVIFMFSAQVASHSSDSTDAADTTDTTDESDAADEADVDGTDSDSDTTDA